MTRSLTRLQLRGTRMRAINIFFLVSVFGFSSAEEAVAQCPPRQGMAPNWCFKVMRKDVPGGLINPYSPAPPTQPRQTYNPPPNYQQGGSAQYPPQAYYPNVQPYYPPRNYQPPSNSAQYPPQAYAPSDPYSRAYAYTCVINDDEYDAGESCVYRSNAQLDSGDDCRCRRQSGTIQ